MPNTNRQVANSGVIWAGRVANSQADNFDVREVGPGSMEVFTGVRDEQVFLVFADIGRERRNVRCA